MEYVLVTGGAGYIGSHICKALSKNDFTPVTFDNLSNGHKDFVKWGPLVVGDLRNPSDIEKIFSQFKFYSVVHVAARAYVDESVKNPILYFENNIQGTVNLLDTSIKNNVRSFIFSSSCATYGEVKEIRISENHSQNPVNPYGFSKLAGEKIITYSALYNKFNYAILRYFNVAGSDSDKNIGELHREETHLIPRLIKAALNNETFYVYGDDYSTRDGTAIRDFLHVEDIALAHIEAINYTKNNLKNITCNLGSENGYSVLEIVQTVKEYFPNLKIKYSARRIGDPDNLVADSSFAKSRLGWSPIHSDLNHIIKSAIDWEVKIKEIPARFN